MGVFDTSGPIHTLVVGANRGIGLGLVQRLLHNNPGSGDNPDSGKLGCPIGTVYATYRQIASPQLEALLEQHPDRLRIIPMDVTQESQIAQGIAQIQAQTGRLHLAVYCVGILHEGNLQPEKSLQQIQANHLMHYFQVNSIGAVLLARYIWPLFKHGEQSVFASISAKVGSIGDNRLGGWYGYRASKAALNMLMRTVAIEYSRKSPKTIVVMLHPGTTDTRLSEPFQRTVSPGQLFSVERTATQLLQVIKELQPEDSGAFFSWDGSRLPW